MSPSSTPLKESFRASLMKWMRANGLSLKVENFSEILYPAWESANSSLQSRMVVP